MIRSSILSVVVLAGLGSAAQAAGCSGDDITAVRRPCSAIIGNASIAAPDRAAALLVRGRAYSTAKDYKHAKADLDQATKLDPGNSDVYFYRYLLNYYHLNDTPAAIDDLSAAIKLKPRDYLYLTSRAELLEDTNLDAAIADYDTTLALSEDDISTGMKANYYFARGRLLEKKGNDKAALADYEAAIAGGNAEPPVVGARDALRKKLGAVAAATPAQPQPAAPAPAPPAPVSPVPAAPVPTPTVTVGLPASGPVLTFKLPATWTSRGASDTAVLAVRQLSSGTVTLLVTLQPTDADRVPLRAPGLEPGLTFEATPSRLTWRTLPVKFGDLSCAEHPVRGDALAGGTEPSSLLRCHVSPTADLYAYLVADTLRKSDVAEVRMVRDETDVFASTFHLVAAAAPVVAAPEPLDAGEKSRGLSSGKEH